MVSYQPITPESLAATRSTLRPAVLGSVAFRESGRGDQFACRRWKHIVVIAVYPFKCCSIRPLCVSTLHRLFTKESIVNELKFVSLFHDLTRK